MRGATLSGTGSYVPEQVITNRDLERIVDTTDEWIVSHTGMRERRIAAPEQASSDLGTEAARAALADAGLEPDDLGLIICATISPDTLIPGAGSLIQANLGASRCGAFDLASGCTGFIYGLGMAAGYVRAGYCEHALVVATETLTRLTNWTDRSTCVLFGDGAGAAVVSGIEGEGGLLALELISMGEAGDLLKVPGGGSRRPLTPELLAQRADRIVMNGPELFKLAVRLVPEVAERLVARVGLQMDDIDVLIMHQANQRILDAAAKRLDIPDERVVSIVEKYGNTSAASMPLALDIVNRQGRLRPGDNVLLVGFGAGFTLGGALIRWTQPPRVPGH